MIDLLLLVAGSLALSYCSQRGIGVVRLTNRKCVDIPLVVMIVWLSMYCGLRTAYNDTWTYIHTFRTAPTLEEFFSEDINLFSNPLYYFWQDFFHHHISDNYHLYLVIIAFFTITSFVRFIRKYSDNFTFSMLLFFAIGLYISNFAAMKQCIAMAILTYAIEGLMNRKYVKFYLLLVLAMLFHAYAIMFAILPLFTNRPWTKVTYLTIGVIILVMATFEETLTELLEYADDLGKDIAADQVFDTAGINLFRLAVFAVPPVLSFMFRGWLNPDMDRRMCIMINMSILSFLVMCLGLSSAANLFGRSAIYFEMGTIIALPWIIQNTFTQRSARIVMMIAFVAYMGFFAYGNLDFDNAYSAITFTEFIESLRG